VCDLDDSSLEVGDGSLCGIVGLRFEYLQGMLERNFILLGLVSFMF
jgi:hypothetical protein